MAFVNKRDDELDWITVDEERGIVLRRTGGYGAESSYSFSLTWDDKAVHFIAEQSVTSDGGDGSIIHWQVMNLHVPEGVEVEPDEARRLIEESMQAYGFSCGIETNEKTNVGFAPSLE